MNVSLLIRVPVGNGSQQLLPRLLAECDVKLVERLLRHDLNRGLANTLSYRWLTYLLRILGICKFAGTSAARQDRHDLSKARTGAQLWGGWPFFVRGWRSVRTLNLNDLESTYVIYPQRGLE